ncbi:hypothetical protein HYS92_01635 [Candidatus Daviesbacteria bacterium]|nr:hypothetical protein [Candidatus Daviesbacteria bacterium]
MYLPISILAFILNGIAVTVDKFLLTKVIPDPLLYVFYFSLISCLAVFAIPFTKTPTPEVFILASISTLLWTMGAYFMFKALKVGSLARVIPIIGTLNPLILFVIALWGQTITQNQIWAILALLLGMLFITLTDWQGKLSRQELIFEIVSASFFAFSYLILKEAYLKMDVVTVLVWSRFVLIPIGITILLLPNLRNKILPTQKSGISMFQRGGPLFIFGQTVAGISQLLIFFAISLGSPALVNSLQGTQYVFLFILALFLSKKYPTVFSVDKNVISLFTKFLGITLIFWGLYLLV